MIRTKKKILLYGYGNPGREDDGLGPAFIERIEPLLKQEQISSCCLETNYQLNIEDALLISEYEIVIFIDAARDNISGFQLRVLIPEDIISFSTHAMHPASVLSLCQELYHCNPLAYILAVKGNSWEMKEGLSETGEENLQKAIHFILPYLKDPELLSDIK